MADHAAGHNSSHGSGESRQGRDARIEVAIGGYIVNLHTPSKRSMEYTPPKQAVAKTLDEALERIKEHLE